MKNRIQEIFFAVFLGIFFPGLLFWAVDKSRSVGGTPIDSTTAYVSAESKADLISVRLTDRVEEMDLEDYLIGVVLREMPASFECEALKAQAVVARTYTLKRLISGGKHDDADICTEASCCQGYCSSEEYLSGDGSLELFDKVVDAVIETAGQVLIYEDELIEATYFSCSGGQTEDAKAVWGTDVPYLQSTESPGEEKATHYVDTVTFTLKEFGELLDLKLSGSPQSWIEKTTYTQGGGVDTMYICGEEFKGTTLRQRLGLRSTAFAISIVGSTVTITTKGYGHRVGMSQYGAEAMAVLGAPYTQILSHYYKNTQLVTYDDN